MVGTLTPNEEAQLAQTIEMFEVITQSQPQDYQSLEILKEAYFKLGREKELNQTSKRIAQAYVMMGQLSSAILEYESILQRCPEDPEVIAALGEIESKAKSLNDHQVPAESTETLVLDKAAPAKAVQASTTARPDNANVDDGREAMFKLFVEAKVITAADFDLCWPKQDWTAPPTKAVEPFVHHLAEKNIKPLEKSLKLISDKARLAYLPLEKYDLDIELVRKFPVETCLRWCVLPFDRMSKSILVATANPFNRQAATELEQAGKQRLLWYLAPPMDILKVLKKLVR